MNSTIRVLASPGFREKLQNPYTWHLYSNLRGRVDDFTYRNAFLRPYDIVHFHWPENVLNQSGSVLMAQLRLTRQFAAIDYMRMRGSRLFWTVHNLHSHERRFPCLEERFWKAFTRRLHGYIALSEYGRTTALERFPALRTIPGFVIPHGNYRESYVPNGCDPRRILGIPAKAQVILYLGQIRPYKNVPKLIKEFRALSDPNTILIIAGRPASEQLKVQVSQECSGDDRIRLDAEYIPEEKVCHYFQAADLVVLPYKEILNSGTALLSLSLNRPLLVPKLGALKELAEELGPEWVRCYEGDLTQQELSQALRWAARSTRSLSAPVDHLAWPLIGQKTLNAYETVLARQSVAAGLTSVYRQKPDYEL